jgi:hypothetical protein
LIFNKKFQFFLLSTVGSPENNPKGGSNGTNPSGSRKPGPKKSKGKKHRKHHPRKRHQVDGSEEKPTSNESIGSYESMESQESGDESSSELLKSKDFIYMYMKSIFFPLPDGESNGTTSSGPGSSSGGSSGESTIGSSETNPDTSSPGGSSGGSSGSSSPWSKKLSWGKRRPRPSSGHSHEENDDHSPMSGGSDGDDNSVGSTPGVDFNFYSCMWYLHQLGVHQDDLLSNKRYWLNVCREDLGSHKVVRKPVNNKMINRKCVRYLRKSYHITLSDLKNQRTFWLSKCKDAGIARYQ